ncbi:bifunctional adenosylcobinamide kinase/adenosylcobinamide-phosphate guanylyltransferase [Williamwhitmania taraxaci]|uniref:Adenosylcobinamide kinase n=1 Tax=Williamwhitmania taraxaci TaxID=1640674 RepID=A0A1G6MLX8_9BACT|nr:bifunctional adenosylcobinamide kinase/adenosylcobinamide-phosphate guanylyltransferase [Williamwhitmania taraxaci]SDC56618.1 adenosylcobinamide kinase /adenosylcobinamide-phosphate guanylyltransferase [Williamwhitmania taraxaci]
MIHLITGGQRSGKSRQAQQLALNLSPRPVYVATSRIWDEEHGKRITRHREDRANLFDTVEEELRIGELNLAGRVVVVDCITLWLTNIFFDFEADVERSLIFAKEQLALLAQQDAHLLLVSNEIGMGGTSPNELQVKFTDLQGFVNQHIAQLADNVTLMVSGIPVSVK